MTLHSVLASSVLGTTGSGTEDTLAAAGFSPTGDNEAQDRGAGYGKPSLVGIDSFTSEIVKIGATTLKDFFKIGNNCWTQAQYIKAMFMKHFDTAAKFGHMYGDGQPLWLGKPIPLAEDSDWDVKVASTTASMTAAVMLYERYGSPLPYRGGQLISRLVAFTADDATTFKAGPSITDLDPRVTYRVAGLQLAGVEDKNHLAARVTSASNKTYVGALLGSATATTFHPNTQPVWFPHDSILVRGVESVVVESLSQAGQLPQIIVFLEEYGGVGVSQPAPSGGGDALSDLLGGMFGGGSGAAEMKGGGMLG